jgi:hypothetical protein
MIKKRIFLTIVFILLIGLGTFFTCSFFYKNSQTASNIKTGELHPITSQASTGVLITVMEAGLTDEELINASDIIVRGKITKVLGEYEYIVGTDDNAITFQRINYDFDLYEVLKGDNVNNITISFTGDMVMGAPEFNKEYVFCLYHTDGDLENAYSFVSLTQGNFLVSSDGTISSNKTMKLEDFKDKIREIEDKIKNGIEIENPLDNINEK